MGGAGAARWGDASIMHARAVHAMRGGGGGPGAPSEGRVHAEWAYGWAGVRRRASDGCGYRGAADDRNRAVLRREASMH
jgi:hypothetical protein